MNTYFGYGDVPIGLVRHGVANPGVFIDYKALPEYKKADGTLMFRSMNISFSKILLSTMR